MIGGLPNKGVPVLNSWTRVLQAELSSTEHLTTATFLALPSPVQLLDHLTSHRPAISFSNSFWSITVGSSRNLCDMGIRYPLDSRVF